MSGQDEREQHTIENLKRRYGRTPAAAPKRGPMGGRHGAARMASSGGRMPRGSRQAIGRLMHYLNEDKPRMILALFCVIVNTVATLAGSYMLRPIINTFIAPPWRRAWQSGRAF